MAKQTSNINFKLISLTFRFRDLLVPRMNVLKEVGIKPGSYVLDYGCGPGSYIAPLAELLGESGRIYALDIHPLAIKAVKSIASRRRLTNVETIQSIVKLDCQIIVWMLSFCMMSYTHWVTPMEY